MLDIPEDMKVFINDYKMNLVEARKNNLKLHNINNKDLFNLFGILLNRNGNLNEIKEKAINYAAEHKVEKSVIMTVTGAVNCKRRLMLICVQYSRKHAKREKLRQLLN